MKDIDTLDLYKEYYKQFIDLSHEYPQCCLQVGNHMFYYNKVNDEFLFINKIKKYVMGGHGYIFYCFTKYFNNISPYHTTGITQDNFKDQLMECLKNNLEDYNFNIIYDYIMKVM